MAQRIKHHKRKLNAKGKRKRRRRIIKRLIRILIFAIPIILICMIGSCARNAFKGKDDKEKTQEVSAPQPATATLISAGDVIMHGPFLKSSHYQNDDGTYDYNSIFTYVKDTYNSADFSIVNLENTISEDNYTSYPMFRGPAAMATALANNGIDMCLLANNHIYDNFGDGLTMTQDAMDANSLMYTGIHRTMGESIYKIIDVNGIKIGIFNYTYETEKNENGERTINSLAVSEENLALINTFNYDELDSFYSEISAGLTDMKTKEVDYTIAYLHWGTEYQTEQSVEQQEIAQELCDLGIDALIGGHPHVIQPVDLLTSTIDDHQMLCVYSVGNHVTNQHEGRISQSPNGHTEDGLMVKLIIDRDEEGNVSLTNAEFIPTWTYRTVGVSDDSNPEFYIFPLDDPEGIVVKAKDTSNLDIQSNIERALERTKEITGEGISKVQQVLPITNHKNTETDNTESTE